MEDEEVDLVAGAKSMEEKATIDSFEWEEPLNFENFQRILYEGKNFEWLNKEALAGSQRTLGLRTVAWRYFLGILPETDDLEKWRPVVEKYREEYKKQYDRYNNVSDQIKNADPKFANPLAVSTSNPWNSFFEDSELKSKIRLDVDRTLQEKDFFQLLEIKNQLVNILFLWSKEHEDISYRQGMNELLGTILYAFYNERVKAADVAEYETPSDKLAAFLNNSDFLEAEIYVVFSRVMEMGTQEMFRPNNVSPKKMNSKLFRNDPVQKRSAVLDRIGKIFNIMLKTVDKELYTHLKKEEIEPQPFLLRWLRCLLNREFHLLDTLALWDAIFADHFTNASTEKIKKHLIYEDFLLLDLICVGMITFVRTQLLQRDASGCFTRLMKYPPVEDPQLFVRLALQYKDSLLDPNKKSALESGLVQIKPESFSAKKKVEESEEAKTPVVVKKEEKKRELPHFMGSNPLSEPAKEKKKVVRKTPEDLCLEELGNVIAEVEKFDIKRSQKDETIGKLVSIEKTLRKILKKH